MPARNPSFVLKCSCTDTTGIVAAVTDFLARRNALLTEANHFVDPATQKSFVRLVFRDNGRGLPELATLQAEFGEQVARKFAMRARIFDTAKRCRALLAVSRQGHCLNSLLHRWKAGHLPIDVVGVVSNHQDQRSLTQWHGLEFHYLPIEPGAKAEQEARMLALFAELDADLLVLARYMQILTAHACELLTDRAINIHHSFLPGFKGAKPYTQAFNRGVKLIGATAHYVTADLDEGPIIEQAVERVNHSMGPRELERLGHDLEAVVLNRAVGWHAEHRVFRNGDKTVVLRS